MASECMSCMIISTPLDGGHSSAPSAIPVPSERSNPGSEQMRDVVRKLFTIPGIMYKTVDPSFTRSTTHPQTLEPRTGNPNAIASATLTAKGSSVTGEWTNTSALEVSWIPGSAPTTQGSLRCCAHLTRMPTLSISPAPVRPGKHEPEGILSHVPAHAGKRAYGNVIALCSHKSSASEEANRPTILRGIASQILSRW